MASKPTEALRQELDQIIAAYDADFAGRSRATRDLDQIKELVRRLQALIAQLDKLPASARDAEHSGLLEDVRTRLATYENEQRAIADAKAAGPEFGEFSQQAAFANQVFARYGRHFAGHDRGTRDLGLLTEMVEELGAIRKRMSVTLVVNPNPDFQRDADVVSNLMQMYENELHEIPKAQASGTADEQAGRLAVLANSQFELYRAHFAGQSRVTRRPALLQRLIANLRRIRAAMRDLKPSTSTAQNNRKNIEIVDGNLRMYETELGELRKARQSTPIRDILSQLGGAANDLFAEYRTNFAGKDRRSVDLALLGVINDKLGEIARQMADLGRTESNEMNERNLGIVMEQLASFEQEYAAIAKLKQPNS